MDTEVIYNYNDNDNDIELNLATLNDINVDDELIKEMNTDIKQIEQDLADLLDSMRQFDELVYKDGAKLVIAENNVHIADNDILQGDDGLQVVVYERNQELVLKSVIGALIGGTLIGTGSGLVFGIVGGICGVLTGGTAGAGVGFLSKYLM